MNANFFNSLKEGNVQLTRDQLKQINGGDTLYAVALAACGEGNNVICSGDTCVSQDNVGCSCSSADGTVDQKDCTTDA